MFDITLGVPVVRRYDLLSQFLQSIPKSDIPPDRVVIIDNGGDIDRYGVVAGPTQVIVRPTQNLGCSASWNTILDHCPPDGLAIIANDDIILASHSFQMMIDGLSKSDLVLGHGFSLFLLRRSLVDRVGWFDENFHPSYYEDNDFARRCRLAGIEPFHSGSGAQHVGAGSLVGLSVDETKEQRLRFGKLKSYFLRKWGGKPGEERYKVPFRGRPPPKWKERVLTR